MDDSAPAASQAATPLDVDGVGATQVGTALWAIALVVLLIFRDELAEHGNEWWIPTAVAGVVVGALAIAYTRWRRAAITRARARRTG